MTIASNTQRIPYLTDGSTTVFPVGIQAYAASDFTVVLTNNSTSISTLLVLNSDYTLVATGSLSPQQWSLTTQTGQFTSPYASGSTLQIILTPPRTQSTVYAQGEQFPSLALQQNVDRAVQLAIRANDQNSRTLRAPDGDVNAWPALPPAAQRANLTQMYDSTGLPTLGTTVSQALTQSLIGQFLYPQTAAEAAAGVTPVNYAFPSPGIESGDVLRYAGGVAPAAMHDVMFFDATQTQIVIGNNPYPATNLWFSNGTAASRPQEFAGAFQYVSKGGGTFNDDSKFGVALVVASRLTGGSRAIFSLNAIAEVAITGAGPNFGRQATAIAFEADVNNNSSADVGLTTNAYDQIVGIRSASGGLFKAQVGFQTVSPGAANRWRVGAGIANWSDYGVVIVQDPGTFTTDASGTNTGTITVTATLTAGSAVIAGTNTFVLNTPVVFSGSLAAVTGITLGTVYYVSATGLSGTQFEVSATPSGGVITMGGSGGATPNVGIPAQGPAILMQPSTDGANPMMRLRNAANSADAWMVLQNGSQQLANNQTLGWVGSDAVVRTALFVSGADNAYFMSAKTAGILANQALQSAVSWGSVTGAAALSFFSGALTNQITGYGTPTGGSHQGSFAAGSITLPNLAAAVAQLIIDLKTYGLVAA